MFPKEQKSLGAQYKESYGTIKSTLAHEHLIPQDKLRQQVLLEKCQNGITVEKLKCMTFLHYENQDLMADDNLCHGVDHGPPLLGSCIKYRPLS